ncbi:hypothetical protein N7463_010314 [Penicillium fimorum]|uniref:Uncharacterized protein n=1 Tax=Penicillium fimorum TaxID=1882269 RepID=A0A9X0C175_9EURO|nr:hypothetical protein N7463_010314 [Penicillium fimorum]
MATSPLVVHWGRPDDADSQSDTLGGGMLHIELQVPIADALWEAPKPALRQNVSLKLDSRRVTM